MTDCTFTPTDTTGTYRCATCGREVVSARFSAEQLHFSCVAAKPPRLPRRSAPRPDVTAEASALAEATGDPSFVALGVRYAKALLRWGKAGCPVRTDEEVAAIVAICESAMYQNKKGEELPCYDAGRQTCRLCGCCVSTKGMAIRNKAKMATGHCPRKLW
jgi:hypothetical protein